MFDLPPEEKRDLFDEELLKIDHNEFTDMMEIGKDIQSLLNLTLFYPEIFIYVM